MGNIPQSVFHLICRRCSCCTVKAAEYKQSCCMAIGRTKDQYYEARTVGAVRIPSICSVVRAVRPQYTNFLRSSRPLIICFYSAWRPQRAHKSWLLCRQKGFRNCLYTNDSRRRAAVSLLLPHQRLNNSATQIDTPSSYV